MQNKPIFVDFYGTDRELLIDVRDNGIGIPETDQKRIFEPFMRAKNVNRLSGSGLGLSIIQKSVEILDGKIEFISKENQGTTFTLTLPKINSEK